MAIQATRQFQTPRRGRHVCILAPRHGGELCIYTTHGVTTVSIKQVLPADTRFAVPTVTLSSKQTLEQMSVHSVTLNSTRPVTTLLSSGVKTTTTTKSNRDAVLSPFFAARQAKPGQARPGHVMPESAR